MATSGARARSGAFANLLQRGDLVHRDDFGLLLFHMLSAMRWADNGGEAVNLDAGNAWDVLVRRSSSLASLERQAEAVGGRSEQAVTAGFQDSNQQRALMRAVLDVLCSERLDFGSSTREILAAHKPEADCNCVHRLSGPLNVRESTCIIGQCLLRAAFDATPAAERYFRFEKMVEKLKLLADCDKGVAARAAAAAAPLPPPHPVLDMDCDVFRPRQLTTSEVDTLAAAL